MLLNRYLSLEIFLVHIGHGVLFWVVLAILAIELPWWASLLMLPIAVFSVAGVGVRGANRSARGHPPLAGRNYDTDER